MDENEKLTLVEVLKSAKNILVGVPGPLNGNKLEYNKNQIKELWKLDRYLDSALSILESEE